METKFKYIYGPVPSWRLGSSLGIDLLSQDEKICNFDCIYCQVGKTKNYQNERKIYVPIQNIIDEIKKLPAVHIDYLTFSSRGEPTLAKNLGDAIKAVREIRNEKIAVLTNAALIGLDDVRKDLMSADFVCVKLDACSSNFLAEINKPDEGIDFENILAGIKQFRQDYKGKLALQIMFIDKNKHKVEKYLDLVKQINPDEVQVNTSLRFCNVNPLSKEEILKIKNYFISVCKGINIVSVYDDRVLENIVSISDEDTLRRRGKIK